MSRKRLSLIGLVVVVVSVIVALAVYHPWVKATASGSGLARSDKLPAQRVIPVPSVTASPQPSASPAPTARLQISAISVDAPIISVGLTATGDLDAPKTLYQVAVYSGGPWPGQPGTAVVDGHSGAPGQVGVLEHLSRLRPDDEVVIVSSQGVQTRFVVTSSQPYPVTPATARILFAKTSAPTMNLISCYGNWDAKTQLYDQRWIVTTRLAD